MQSLCGANYRGNSNYMEKKQKMTHRRMQNSVHGAENSRKTAEDCNYVDAMVIMI